MINKSNIEHWIFQYHEGLLSSKDKTALLDFLAQHPEFYEEFTLWATTKLSADPNLVDLELENSLLRPVSPPSPQNTSANKHTKGSLFWSTFMTLSLLLLCRGDQKSLYTAFSFQGTSIAPIAQPLKARDPERMPYPKNIADTQVRPKAVHVYDTLQNGMHKELVIDSRSIQADTVMPTKALLAVPDTIHTSLVKLDTVQTLSAPIKKESTKAPIQKTKKKRSKINFSPSKEFINDNSDF